MKRKGQVQRHTERAVTPPDSAIQDRAFAEQGQARPSAHSFGSMPLHSAPIIQRVVDPYKANRKLASNSVTLKGLDEQQREQMQSLHQQKNNHYTIDEARKNVGAAPTPSTTAPSSGQNLPPFSFRYDRTNQGGGHMGGIDNSGGMVQYPHGGLPQQNEDDISQISINTGSTYDDLTKTSKRGITQSASMGYVSPNSAADEIGFECPTTRSWEWLHLAAFSLGVTHVPEISATSRTLIERIGQPQQIPENLVLGSAAANTAMLTYESEIKGLMQQNPTWKLHLWVNAQTQEHQADNSKGVAKSIRVASRIDYHFYFANGNDIVGPVVLAFNPMSHDKPTLNEYQTATAMLQQVAQKTTTVSNQPHGIKTNGMVGFSPSGQISGGQQTSDSQQDMEDDMDEEQVDNVINTWLNSLPDEDIDDNL